MAFMRGPDPAPSEPFDSFARDHLPPPEALPEFLFERPSCSSRRA